MNLNGKMWTAHSGVRVNCCVKWRSSSVMGKCEVDRWFNVALAVMQMLYWITSTCDEERVRWQSFQFTYVKPWYKTIGQTQNMWEGLHISYGLGMTHAKL